MKKILGLIILSIIVALGAGFSPAQSGHDLFQKALVQERTEGNLQQAIQLYQRIVRDFSSDRPLAAKALLQMGECYEKLGKDEARKAYERLVRDYADQSEEARLARTRLAALRKPAVKESGMVTRQVWTTHDMGNIEGAPSPDGRFLTFVDWNTGDLAVHDLETGTDRRLTNKGPWENSDEFAMFSRWSPDGKLIAYDWYDGKCCVDLHVITREGGEPRVLVDYESNQWWMQTYDWSPDGKQILIFLEKQDGTSQIVLVSATDGATKVLRAFKGRGGWPQIMRFSRDGHYIAYDRPQGESSAEHDIFLLSADGSHEIPLVKHPADDRLLGWPPNGEGILFSSDRTGSLDMWFLPVSGGDVQGAPELIKPGVERIAPLGFTQNGSFYYALGQWMVDVYVARLDPESGKTVGSPEKAIMRFEGRNSWPDYSPDGKYLAYLTTRSRAFQSATSPNILCIRSLETGQEREFPTQFNLLADPRWSPDGQFLYLAAWDNQGMGIYRVNAQSGEFAPVVRAEPPARLYQHAVSPDGNTLVYERMDRETPEQFRTVTRNLATGEEKELYAGDRSMCSISPSGQWLAYINWGKKRVLRVMPLSGGEPKELLRFEEERSYAGPIAWTAEGKYILFSRVHPAKGTEQYALWRIAAEGGEPEGLNLVMAAFENLSVHPDGEHLAFSSMGPTRKSPAVWVVENFLPPGGSSRSPK